MKRVILFSILSAISISASSAFAVQIGQKDSLNQFKPGSFHCERARELAAQKESETKNTYEQAIKGKTVASKSLSDDERSSSEQR